jgi:hypothetical protein
MDEIKTVRDFFDIESAFHEGNVPDELYGSSLSHITSREWGVKANLVSGESIILFNNYSEEPGEMCSFSKEAVEAWATKGFWTGTKDNPIFISPYQIKNMELIKPIKYKVNTQCKKLEL